MQVLQDTRQPVHQMESIARSSRSIKRSSQKRPRKSAAEKFLNLKFLPRYEPALNLPDKQQTEKDFFSSLRHLADYYGFLPLDVQAYDYPYNLLMSYHDALAKLQELDIYGLYWHYKTDRNQAKTGFLSTVEEVDLCEMLYFIPVIPVYRLLSCKGAKRLGELLLSVLAFLYRAGIQYYREDGTAIFYDYEMLADSLPVYDDLSEEELHRYESELNSAGFIGDVMLRKISNPIQLRCFRERVESFKPGSLHEHIATDIAKACHALFLQYPKRKIFAHTPANMYKEGVYCAEHSLAFVSSLNGWIMDELEQFASCTKGECMEMANPILKKSFLKAKKKYYDGGLHFEGSCLGIIQRLIYLLNSLS